LKLKEHVDMAAFLDATAKCAGDVFFHSADGDILNLKSLLSQYILVSIVCNPGLLENAQIICVREEDYASLTFFLQPEPAC